MVSLLSPLQGSEALWLNCLLPDSLHRRLLRRWAADAAADATTEGADDAADEGADDLTCAAQSFTPGTGVVLASGASVPIASITVGTKVAATNPATGVTTGKTVAHVWVDRDDDLLNLTVTSGGMSSVVHTTQHHPFWDVTKNAWVEADKLTSGDQLLSLSGVSVTFTSAAIAPGAADMWDLTVAGDHDFYIQAHGGGTVMVHNNSCGTINMDHIMDEHGPGTEANGKGTFKAGTSEDDIESMIAKARSDGTSEANTLGRNGLRIHYRFAEPIGTNGAGRISYVIRVIQDGNYTRSAFPI